jgi:hypothetical protein
VLVMLSGIVASCSIKFIVNEKKGNYAPFCCAIALWWAVKSPTPSTKPMLVDVVG